jgi:glycerophosphoryl diester phosphodiesterase
MKCNQDYQENLGCFLMMFGYRRLNRKEIVSVILLFLFFMIPIICEAEYIEVQGHRGARGVRLENTLPAFEAAIEAGVDMIELDVVVTKDGELVIFHDFFINPDICANPDGSDIPFPVPLIYSLSLFELKQFECKPDPLFPEQLPTKGIRIPTLQELFTMISNSSHPHAKKVQLNLEIKRDPNQPELTPLPAVLAEKVLDIVKKNDFSNRVYYSSFDSEVLFELRRLDADISIAYLKEGDLEYVIETALELKACIVSPEYTLIRDANFVHSLKQLGFKVVVWTVNDNDHMMELIKLGVNGIITDYPEKMIKLLEENNLRTSDSH